MACLCCLDIITGCSASSFYRFIHSTTNIYLVLTGPGTVLGADGGKTPVFRSSHFWRRNKQVKFTIRLLNDRRQIWSQPADCMKEGVTDAVCHLQRDFTNQNAHVCEKAGYKKPAYNLHCKTQFKNAQAVSTRLPLISPIKHALGLLAPESTDCNPQQAWKGDSTGAHLPTEAHRLLRARSNPSGIALFWEGACLRTVGCSNIHTTWLERKPKASGRTGFPPHPLPSSPAHGDTHRVWGVIHRPAGNPALLGELSKPHMGAASPWGMKATVSIHPVIS